MKLCRLHSSLLENLSRLLDVCIPSIIIGRGYFNPRACKRQVDDPHSPSLRPLRWRENTFILATDLVLHAIRSHLPSEACGSDDKARSDIEPGAF
jgi:hypothetical protein